MENKPDSAGINYAKVLALTLAVPTIVLVALVLRHNEPTATEIALTRALQEQRIADNTQETIQRIRYVQDSRTGICFAYLPAGNASGLATVDCAQVPANLLITGTSAETSQ